MISIFSPLFPSVALFEVPSIYIYSCAERTSIHYITGRQKTHNDWYTLSAWSPAFYPSTPFTIPLLLVTPTHSLSENHPELQNFVSRESDTSVECPQTIPTTTIGACQHMARICNKMNKCKTTALQNHYRTVYRDGPRPSVAKRNRSYSRKTVPTGISRIPTQSTPIPAVTSILVFLCASFHSLGP